MFFWCAVNHKLKLAIKERTRIERVLKSWSKEWERNLYRLIWFPVLEHVGVDKVPSKYMSNRLSNFLYLGDPNTLVFTDVEIKLLKIVRKKIDLFDNDEEDYAIPDELLKVGETQTLSVSPITLTVQKTDKIVNLEILEDNYILTEQIEELPVGQVLRARKAKAIATTSSGVTTTGKLVADDMPLEGIRGKRPRLVNIAGLKDGPVTFEGLAS